MTSAAVMLYGVNGGLRPAQVIVTSPGSRVLHPALLKTVMTCFYRGQAPQLTVLRDRNFYRFVVGLSR